ncbi:MAG: LytTR family DNA-binding domain-containing protein [Bryobacter sp.]|nr:LytTR family DNA-binding domain-containing protein [Bryobacter sp.]
MMRVLISDEERMARQALAQLLSPEPDVQIIAEVTDCVAAADFLRTKHVDIAFVEICSTGSAAWDLLKAARPESRPLIVLLAPNEQSALRAFEANAFDYLLKPFHAERLRTTLSRARQQLSLMDRQGASSASVDSERIPIRTNGRILLLKTEEIDWVEAEHNYVRLHTRQASHLIRETMNGLEGKLNPRRFRRIHRSAIVNVERIQEIQPWFRGDAIVVLENGHKLTASRNFRDRLREYLH